VVRFDHGAPLLSISAGPAPTLLAPLLEAGWIEPWSGALAQLDGEGQLIAGATDPLTQGDLYRGRGGMDQLCRGLLELGGDSLVLNSSQLVRHLARSGSGGWDLLDQDHRRLGGADWLVLSGTLLFLIQHPADEAWRRLPFRLLSFEEAAQRRWGLSRLSIQPLDDGCCAVVAHSTADVAMLHAGVIGSRSSMASLAGVTPSPQREQALIDTLASAVSAVVKPWITPLELAEADPQLMRWGAAFHQPPGLSSELMLCPQSRIGFCGDFTSGPGFGRIEGALRSGEQLAEQLLAAMGPTPVPAQGQPA
jgi:predicted NAD/FAD-dependent oxidoreductase